MALTQSMRRRRHLAAWRIAALLVVPLATVPASAADVPCGVGDRVQGDMGGGGPGEIAEIGTESPHVGWYRLVFAWNGPNGDWYDPRSWTMHPVGSDDRCVPPGAAVAPTPVASNATAAAPATAATPATAGNRPPPTTSTDRCRRGRAVVDRQQRRGEIIGENNGMCVVRLVDGNTGSYLAWMLSDADGSRVAPAGPLPAGTYVCSTQGAGIFRIELDGDDEYTDRNGDEGDYALDEDSGIIAFDGGSLDGYHSKRLGAAKFGLASEATTIFYTICDLDD